MSPGFELSDDDVTRILSQDAYALSLETAGVKRAYGAQLASNLPCEDRFNSVQPLSLWQDQSWVAAAIFDGHNGWQMAEYLKNELLGTVQKRLNMLEPESRTDEMIQSAIETSFQQVDDLIINNYINSAPEKAVPIEEKIHRMQLAMSGSCALLILYNPNTRTVYTACTGDSRAVLAQQTSDGTWERILLSKDQKGTNDAEAERIRQEHPNEEAVIKDGKLLGLVVTRAFGDLAWKAPYDTQLELGKRLYTHGPMSKDDFRTLPYLTAKPVITVQKLEEGTPAFIVMASDGLWDMCENLEALDLVTRWLEAQPGNTLKEMGMEVKMTPETVWWKAKPEQEANYAPGFDFLERFDNLFDVRFLDERTIIQDLDNVAVHLLRNACGGNHRQLLAAKLAYQPPFARNVRDDITVQVLFF